MNKEKKQIVVLVSLVAVVGAVGAFQFMSKGPSDDIVAKVDDKPKAVEPTRVRPNGGSTGELFTLPMVKRDPFVPQAILIDLEDDPRPTGPRGTGIPTPPGPRNFGGTGGPHPQGTGFKKPPVPLPDRVTVEPGLSLGDVALRGVIMGPQPMAIFEGDDGQQTLAVAGDKLPNGALVVSIANGKVILKQKGKTRTIEFEEA